MDSIDHLLKPRYLVIADFPNAKFGVGEILHVVTTVDEADNFKFRRGRSPVMNDEGHFDKYPAIFRPLAWHEHREKKELPEYVKFKKDKISFLSINKDIEPDVHKVKKHRATSLDPHWRYSNENSFISEWHNHNYSYSQFLPATLQEYEEYINKK